MEGLIGWIISLVSGAVGGNVAGTVLKNQSLASCGTPLPASGGGGIGGQILAALGATGGSQANGGLDIGSIISNVAGSGIGGAILLIIVSFITHPSER